MGFFKRAFKPVRKAVKKFIPKEVRPFLPYIAAAFGPAAGGIAGMGFQEAAKKLALKGIIAGSTAAATDEDANILRTSLLAAAPAALEGGLGAISTKYGSSPLLKSGIPKSLQQLPGSGDPAQFFSETVLEQGLSPTSGSIGTSLANAAGKAGSFIGKQGNVKTIGAQAGIDQSAKFAEIRQDEIDEYNRNLLEQGVASKVDRRNAIFSIYKNAGYDDDYVNTMLDTYGYADGGRISGGRNMTGVTAAMQKFYKGLDEKLPMRKPVSDIEVSDDDEVVIEEDGKIKVKRKSDVAGGLMAAMDGVQKAYGRSFGEMEPVPMMRFARGGEVEIEEETDDLGIMDLMRDQGVEYGEQVSNAQNDELLEKLFEEFLDLGFSPEDAAKKAREAFDDMSQGQGIKGTQVASGYKDDIEEMYEQYVFEMEEQGLEPMDFASFLRQARSGMAGGGKVGALMELGKAGIKSSMQGLSKLKNMVVTKLSRMTDDVELRGSTDYAEDTGASFELQVTAKTKKGKKTLDSLVEEGVVEKLDDNTYFISDANRDAISGMKGLKASGMLDEGAETFTRFDQGAGRGVMDMPYAGYDEVIDTFSKKAEGGIMNRNLLNTGMDKDMRGGGFIPEGTKEKADDVPARLSKNEFVMTADAVRAAGGGSINEGAKRMYDTMHKLEAKV